MGLISVLLTLELLDPGQLPSYLRAIQNILMNLFACSQVNKSMYFWLLVIIQYGFIKAGTRLYQLNIIRITLEAYLYNVLSREKTQSSVW